MSRSTTKTTAARLDPAVRRAQLIDAASDLFAKPSAGTVGLEDVADAAGVSRSLVYAYFGDRGGLLAAVYLRNLEQLDADLARAIQPGLPDERQLRRIVRRYLQFARDNEGTWWSIAHAEALQHPAVRGARRDRIERIVAAWSTGPETRLVATAVVALLEAGVRHWFEERPCGLERATDTLTELIWSGVAGVRDRVLAAG